MTLTTKNYRERPGDSLVQQIIRQLPTLRYSLYVIIPLVLMREIPNYVDHVNPVTNEEKLLAFGLIITSSTTLGYLTLRKFFYNLNKYWTLGGAALGSGVLTLGANLMTLSFTMIGLFVGLSIAAKLSHEIANFDIMQYQRDREKKKRNDLTPKFELTYLEIICFNIFYLLLRETNMVKMLVKISSKGLLVGNFITDQ